MRECEKKMWNKKAQRLLQRYHFIIINIAFLAHKKNGILKNLQLA